MYVYIFDSTGILRWEVRFHCFFSSLFSLRESHFYQIPVSLWDVKKSWTTDGENQYFPFTQSTSHFVFLADNARSPRSRNFHSWQDNIDSEILSQMKVLENSIGISNPNWCGRVMLVWSIKVSHMLDSSPVSDSWQPPHTARAWGGGTQGGMSSEDKGCRRGNKMAEFNASGVWQKFIERLKWSQELLAAMWETCEFQCSLMESV